MPKDIEVWLVLGILAFFILLEVMAGYWSRSKRQKGDWIQEALGFLSLSMLFKPGIVLLVLAVGEQVFPALFGILSAWPIWVGVLLYLLVDDLVQYWYHRSAHEYLFLWKLHRPHHQAEEMGFLVSYRNAALYYLLMPNIWWLGICIFSGLAIPVAIGIVAKQLIIISTHSAIQYDKLLYRYQWMKPLVTIWERIFITPAFHHAHHGKTKLDGISDPNGNFGNMFSFWDQLFGTAQFTHDFPNDYGLPNDTKDHWSAAFLYPFMHSNNPKSELSKNYQKKPTTTLKPIVVDLEKSKNYLWCACGLSKNQPFCDGSHQGTKLKPVLFESKRSGACKLCTCKQTKSPPYCDDTHLSL